ncbi:MAG: hypothetical protein Q8P02_04830, partial [Candidatus Micrarchaeota archaeon]|nr:hypothetical protein [Candidatus Micrarchaeota archaeon]
NLFVQRPVRLFHDFHHVSGQAEGTRLPMVEPFVFLWYSGIAPMDCQIPQEFKHDSLFLFGKIMANENAAWAWQVALIRILAQFASPDITSF